MTNGEKMEKVFGLDINVLETSNYSYIVPIEWWDAEYKEPSSSEKPNKSDNCISREQALHLLCKKCPVYNCIQKCLSYKAIEKMPSVTPQEPKWIPCSERLPEESGYYLTTTMYGEVYCDYWTGISFDRQEIIIAWMPLPKVYKAESGDNNEL